MTSHPAAPESEAPETDAFAATSSYSNPLRPSEILAFAKRLERRLHLAQTEINGHMRIEDDLKRDLGLERESHEVTKRMLGDRDGRIAELEKDATRLEAILAIWKAHRSDQYAEDPDEVDSYDRVCDLLDAALKDRA